MAAELSVPLWARVSEFYEKYRFGLKINGGKMFGKVCFENSMMRLIIGRVVKLSTFPVVCMLLSVFSTAANAQTCIAPYVSTVSGPSSINVDPALPVGSVLWKGSAKQSASYTGGPCGGGPGGGGATYTVYWDGIPYYLGGSLYETGIPGVAFRMKFQSACAKDWWPIQCTNNWGPGFPSSLTLNIELVKVGQIIGGGTMSGAFASVTQGAGRQLYATYIWAAPVVIQPKIPTCSVTTPLITVPLGTNIPLNAFTGIGSTSASQPFNISLQCSGGDAGRTTNVNLTLTDPANPSNQSDTLALSSASTAKGIGIQISEGTTILRFGPDSNAPGNVNQWSAGAAANGTFDIPLTARYVQTAPKVTGGIANGKATFTMSYQ